MTLTPDPEFATQVILRVHYSVTITFTAFKKKYLFQDKAWFFD